MSQLPLFPLNTVLFPGVPINLHIFEPRYQKMIRYCLSESHPFGVVLIRRGTEAMGPVAEPFEVGCSAAIMETEALGDGRMNISAVGVDRFRIRSLDHDQPYLIGEVEKFPILRFSDSSLKDLAANLRPWVSKYLRLIAEKIPDDIEEKYLPDEPAALAYLSAFLVQAPARDKQDLLEIETMPGMLASLIELYKRETALIRALVHGEGPTEAGFGLN